MEKLYTSKTFLKMAGGRMHTPHPTPLDPTLATSYRNHQNSLVYFSHLAPLVFFTKKQSQKEEHEQRSPPKIRFCGEEQKRSTRPQMSCEKIKGPWLDSRKEFIFLQVPAGRIKWSRGPDSARGPYVVHAWFTAKNGKQKCF